MIAWLARQIGDGLSRTHGVKSTGGDPIETQRQMTTLSQSALNDEVRNIVSIFECAKINDVRGSRVIELIVVKTSRLERLEKRFPLPGTRPSHFHVRPQQADHRSHTSPL